MKPSSPIQARLLALLLPALPGADALAQTPGSGTAAAASPNDAQAAVHQRVIITGRRARTLIPGSTLTKEQIPGNVQGLDADQIRAANATSMADLLNSELQSINVNDYQGNPFQMDVSYRGFVASPQLGTSQGLSVFFDGIRVNEPFGDVVNWDLMPLNALAGIDVFPAVHPVFGYNTLGGSLVLGTKNGFDHPGADVHVTSGWFGRRQLQASLGRHGEQLGVFAAGTYFHEKGWRDNSETTVSQAFLKATWREPGLDLHASVMGAENTLIGNGLAPAEMLARRETAVFSSPDRTTNRLLQWQLSGTRELGDGFSISASFYKRRSDRKAHTGDVNLDIGGEATRRPRTGEQPVCAYPDANRDGIPDYYLVPDNIPSPGVLLNTFTKAYNDALMQGLPEAQARRQAYASMDPSTLNLPLPADVRAYVQREAWLLQFNTVEIDENLYRPYPPTLPDGSPRAGYVGPAFFFFPDNFYIAPDGMRWSMIPAQPLNGPCGFSTVVANPGGDNPLLLLAREPRVYRDGAWATADGVATGYEPGTPVAVIGDSGIQQVTRGLTLQGNWNLPRLNLVAGLGLFDVAADYYNCQQLGLFDRNRNAYLDPEHIDEGYVAASRCISNNDFGGTNRAASIFGSATFMPTPEWNLAAGLRLTTTRVSNKLKVRGNNGEADLVDYQAQYRNYAICDGGLLGDCDPNALYKPWVWNPDEFAFRNDDQSMFIANQPRETFHYRSLSPSLGATWTPRPGLNVYANWARGARTPSNIELGCAFDRTPVPQGDGTSVPRGLLQSSYCNLPSTMSGDPALKQIRSTSIEFGARGKLGIGWSWNATVYRTDLTDDIYLVSVSSAASFFDTIPRTRRQGVELGLSGESGPVNFKLNYSLTDATVQSTALLASPYNSSSSVRSYAADYQQIVIRPGDRLAGVPLHNVNARIEYRFNTTWKASLGMVAHSGAFVRGNENNQHQPGPAREILGIASDPSSPTGFRYDVPTGRYAPMATQPGRTPGYAVFNFKTSLRFDEGSEIALLVNNLFDRRYSSAGRLGLNPFSPSIQGHIGVSGFNYNSNEWQASNFLGPGAPRAAWLVYSHDFD